MRKWLVILFGCFALAGGVRAQQFTTVTSTVVDTAGTPYALGTYSVSLVNTTGQQASLGGNSNFQKNFNGALTVAGFFSVNLPSVTQLFPLGMQWTFNICANPQTVAFEFPPVSTPCFSYTSTGTQISGSSVDLSSSMTPVATVIPRTDVTTSNNAFTGNNTHSGTETFTGPADIGKDNNIFVVGSTLYPTCQAAVTAAGTTNKALLIVRSDYAGAACPTGLSATNSNLVIWDFTGLESNESNARQYNGQMWNVNDGVVNAFRKSNFSLESASNFGGTATAIVNGYWITTVNTTTVPTGGTADGISAEANTQNSMSGTLGALTAAEHNSTNRSTGGTITNQQGVMGSVNSDPASTTVVTNAQGVWGRGCKTISGSVPTNCYGLRADDQGNIASNRNFSIYGVGRILVGFSSITNLAGLYLENTVNSALPVVYNDASNVVNLQATSANGIGLNDSGGNPQLTAKSTGLTIAKTLPLPNNTVALTADWTCGTGGTVASCTSATIVGSGGGVPLTFTLPLIAQSYTLECDGVVGQATAVTANQWNLLTATNGATNVTANYSMATAATAYAAGAVTDQASTTTTFQIAPSWTLGAITTKMPFHIYAQIEGASASGTVLSLQLVAPTVGDLVTIYRGTTCRVR